MSTQRTQKDKCKMLETLTGLHLGYAMEGGGPPTNFLAFLCKKKIIMDEEAVVVGTPQPSKYKSYVYTQLSLMFTALIHQSVMIFWAIITVKY